MPQAAAPHTAIVAIALRVGAVAYGQVVAATVDSEYESSNDTDQAATYTVQHSLTHTAATYTVQQKYTPAALANRSTFREPSGKTP